MTSSKKKELIKARKASPSSSKAAAMHTDTDDDDDDNHEQKRSWKESTVLPLTGDRKRKADYEDDDGDDESVEESRLAKKKRKKEKKEASITSALSVANDDDDDAAADDDDDEFTSEEKKETKEEEVKWYRDSDPFEMLCHYAIMGVDIEILRKRYTELEISSLQDLKAKCGYMVDVFPNYNVAPLIDAITEALKQVRFTPEQVLCNYNEGIIYDESCIAEDGYRMYSLAAVSVKPVAWNAKEGERHPRFTLVLGSSGSGKSLFSVRRVPQIIFSVDDDKKYFRIHFKASAVTTFMKTTKTHSFPQAVARIVYTKIASILVDKKHESVKYLDIPIHVTIDEAGGKSFAKYFDETDKIIAIHDANVGYIQVPESTCHGDRDKAGHHYSWN